jgi:uncharacterized membrane protein
MGLPESSDSGSSSGRDNELRMYLIYELFIVTFLLLVGNMLLESVFSLKVVLNYGIKLSVGLQP